MIVMYRTVKSPHILELSGIGDPKILEPLGIPVQLPLPPVGANVQDHLIMSAYVFGTPPSSHNLKVLPSECLQQKCAPATNS